MKIHPLCHILVLLYCLVAWPVWGTEAGEPEPEAEVPSQERVPAEEAAPASVNLAPAVTPEPKSEAPPEVPPVAPSTAPESPAPTAAPQAEPKEDQSTTPSASPTPTPTPTPETGSKEPIELPVEPPSSSAAIPPVAESSGLLLPPSDRYIQFEAGFFNFNYGEEINPNPSNLKSTELGLIPGLRIEAGGKFNDTFFIRGSFSLGDGNTSYNGTDQSGNPLQSTTGDLFLEGEVDLGLAFWRPGPRSFMAFYLGVGYHYWNRVLSSYTEDYSWMFLPVGLLARVALDDRWAIGFDLSTHVLFLGQISAAFSDLGPTLNLADAQGLLGMSRLGARAEIPITYTLSPDSGTYLTAVPWFEYIGLSQGPDFPVERADGSNTGVLAHEPASHADIFGIWLGIGFGF